MLGGSFANLSQTQPDFGGLRSNNGHDRYLTVRQGNYSNFDLYIRVGIPMNQAYSFRSVSILGYV